MPRNGVIKAADIRALTRAQPFQPFRIHMSDGAVFEVPHPEFAMLASGRVIVGAPEVDREGLPQTVHQCVLLHITQLETVEPTPGSGAGS